MARSADDENAAELQWGSPDGPLPGRNIWWPVAWWPVAMPLPEHPAWTPPVSEANHREQQGLAWGKW
jgi:hypothetical protein